MRIIAGKYRGKQLISPKDDAVRPTSDRAREALFSILSSRIDNDWSSVSFLDVFAGTGAVGLEAFSRGACEVCFIDKDISLIKKNSQSFAGADSKIKIIKSNVLSVSKSLKSYDIVFLDAPYAQGLSSQALSKLLSAGWIGKNSLCVIELDRKEDFTLPSGFQQHSERIYGISKFIFAELE